MQLRTRQGGPIPTRQQRPARWADFHTAAAPGKVGRFPHGSGARQGGPIPTQHRRAARWADFTHDATAGRRNGRTVNTATKPNTKSKSLYTDPKSKRTTKRTKTPTPSTHDEGD
nr:hypothetical protein [Klebsiella michiganensis]